MGIHIHGVEISKPSKRYRLSDLPHLPRSEQLRGVAVMVVVPLASDAAFCGAVDAWHIFSEHCSE